MRWLYLSVLIAILSPISFAYATTCYVDTNVSGGNQYGIGYHGGSNADGDYVAASFTPGASCPVGLVSVGLSKSGTPASLTGAIYSDSGGPNTLLSSSHTFDTSGVSACTADNAFFDFASEITLTAGTKYWLVLKKTGSYDNSNKWNWCGTGPTTGNAAQNSSASWSLDNTTALSMTINAGTGGGGGGGGSSTSTATTTSTTNQDEFNLYLVFFSMMVFTVWLGRNRKS